MDNTIVSTLLFYATSPSILECMIHALHILYYFLFLFDYRVLYSALGQLSITDEMFINILLQFIHVLIYSFTSSQQWIWQLCYLEHTGDENPQIMIKI